MEGKSSEALSALCRDVAALAERGDW